MTALFRSHIAAVAKVGVATTVLGVLVSPVLVNAQTLTINNPATSIYTFELPKTYKAQVGTDGKITLRLKLTEHFVTVPTAYDKTLDVAANQVVVNNIKLSDGILGSDLGGNTGNFEIIADPSDALYYRKAGDAKSEGTALEPTPGGPIVAPTGYANLFGIYSVLFKYSGRTYLDNLRKQVIDETVPAVPPPAFPVLPPPIDVFNFGDDLQNLRDARKLALDGIKTIDLHDQGAALAPLISELKLLRDPADIETQNLPDSRKAGIGTSDWQNSGRWFFNFYQVAPTKNMPGLHPMKMVEVTVVWAVEATFDPANTPPFPIVNFGFTPAVTTTDASPSTDNSNAKTQQASTPASGTSTTPSAGLAGSLGFTASGIAPFSGLTDSPGFDLVAGVAVLDNGWARVLGFNAYSPPKGSLGSSPYNGVKSFRL